MSTALTTFGFKGHQLRTVTIDGQPWFIARDLASALGYKDATHACRSLDADEKGLQIVETLGGPQRIVVVSEPALYKLIQGSRRPEAKAFDRWVRHTVLPALRKDGMYVVGEEKVVTGEMNEDELTLLVLERLRSKASISGAKCT